MNYLLEKLTVRSRQIVADKSHIMDILELLNEHQKEMNGVQLMYDFTDMHVQSCGWANNPDKWFIMADISEAKWNVIKYQLKEKEYKVSIAEQKFIFWWSKLKELK